MSTVGVTSPQPLSIGTSIIFFPTPADLLHLLPPNPFPFINFIGPVASVSFHFSAWFSLVPFVLNHPAIPRGPGPPVFARFPSPLPSPLLREIASWTTPRHHGSDSRARGDRQKAGPRDRLFVAHNGGWLASVDIGESRQG